MRRTLTVVVLAIVTAWSVGAVASFAHSSFDFGVWRDKQLADKSNQLFGVDKPRGVVDPIDQPGAGARAPDRPRHTGQGPESARRDDEGPGGR
jgi:hypothetical protein